MESNFICSNTVLRSLYFTLLHEDYLLHQGQGCSFYNKLKYLWQSDYKKTNKNICKYMEEDLGHDMMFFQISFFTKNFSMQTFNSEVMLTLRFTTFFKLFSQLS